MLISDIIKKFEKDGHIIDGLSLFGLGLSEKEIFDIIANSKGRNIIVDEGSKNMLDGQDRKYDGQEDESFNIDKYI